MKQVTTVEGSAHGKIAFRRDTLIGGTKPNNTTATKLLNIARRSRSDHNATFDFLMSHYNIGSLRDCYQRLDGKKAVGIDGTTKDEYGQNLQENLENLVNSMKQMAYVPAPVREVLIPKGKGKYRPLGISNFEDKIVQLMTSRILEAIYDPMFLGCSYGFRPGRSCHTAIKDLNKYLSRNNCDVVIDVDLKNFFETISHEKLVDMLRLNIKDERFIRYVIRMLKAGVLCDGELKVTEEGSPQGNVASPVLSNVFAHYVIDIWFDRVVKKLLKGKAELFRYCDDVVICCQFENDAIRIRKALSGRLTKFGLELNLDKTKFVRFNRQQFRYGYKQEVFDFLGLTFYIGKSRNGFPIIKVKTAASRLRSKLRAVREWCKKNKNATNMMSLWKIFVAKLRGHIYYYGVSFNFRAVSIFLLKAKRIFFKWMNRRSQRKSFGWYKFSLFVNRNPLPKVRIYHRLF